MHVIWKKRASVAFLLLLVLWAAGVARGWSVEHRPTPDLALLPLDREVTQQVQAANNLKQLGLATTPLPLMLDRPDLDKIQVYEKGAQLTAGTAAFAEDEAKLRAALAEHKAVVFNERSTGLSPERRLTLQTGVPPERFDALVEQLQGVALLDSISVHHRDRTGEFRRLLAQQQSLKKHLEAVLKLRGRDNASIDDTLKVEQKVQDIEKDLRNLGVQLGELLGHESFYQVSFTLYEYQPGSRFDPTFTLPRRLGHALVWALSWWFVAAGAVGAVVGTYFSVRTLTRRE